MDIIELKEDEMRGRKPHIPTPEGFAIAGGAIRRWFTGEQQDSDIDLFRIGEGDSYELEIDGLRKQNETKMAINYDFHGQRVQSIKRTYSQIKSMFAFFDFHHCQFAYMEGKIFSTKKAVICALRKHLSLNNIQEGFELDTLRRSYKYQRQGFTPCRGTIGKLAQEIQQSQSDLQEQLILSPSGGRRNIIRFD